MKSLKRTHILSSIGLSIFFNCTTAKADDFYFDQSNKHYLMYYKIDHAVTSNIGYTFFNIEFNKIYSDHYYQSYWGIGFGGMTRYPDGTSMTATYPHIGLRAQSHIAPFYEFGLVIGQKIIYPVLPAERANLDIYIKIGMTVDINDYFSIDLYLRRDTGPMNGAPASFQGLSINFYLP